MQRMFAYLGRNRGPHQSEDRNARKSFLEMDTGMMLARTWSSTNSGAPQPRLYRMLAETIDQAPANRVPQ